MTSSHCLSDSSSAGRKKTLALDFVAGYVIPQKLQLLLIHQLLQQQPSSVSPPPTHEMWSLSRTDCSQVKTCYSRMSLLSVFCVS